jgi:hypothetical protein
MAEDVAFLDLEIQEQASNDTAGLVVFQQPERSFTNGWLRRRGIAWRIWSWNSGLKNPKWMRSAPRSSVRSGRIILPRLRFCKIGKRGKGTAI